MARLLPLVLLLSSACGGEPAAVLVTPSGHPATPSATAAASPAVSDAAPRVSIASPKDGETLPAGPVTVTVDVSGFTLEGATGASAGAPRGGLIFYIDVDFVPTAPGAPALTSAGTFQRSSTTSTTWASVAPGFHALFVQLVDKDDHPLSPAVTARAVITVT